MRLELLAAGASPGRRFLTRLQGMLRPWSVVTTTDASEAKPTGTRSHAVVVQRVQVPPREAPEPRVAGPQRRERSRPLKPGVGSERVRAT
jgi:hypothetical protein